MRVKPFDDVRARRAVGGYGIDRVEIAKVAFQGRAKPLVSVLAPGVRDAIDLNERYPYRPDEAKIQLVDTVAAVDRVLVKHEFEMTVSNFATLRDINQRSVSFFKGKQSDYMGIDDPNLEAMVLQWRRTMEPAGR